jgi:hypothetical protein
VLLNPGKPDLGAINEMGKAQVRMKVYYGQFNGQQGKDEWMRLAEKNAWLEFHETSGAGIFLPGWETLLAVDMQAARKKENKN